MSDDLVVRGCILRWRYTVYGSGCLAIEMVLPYEPEVIRAIERIGLGGEIDIQLVARPRYQQFALMVFPVEEGVACADT